MLLSPLAGRGLIGRRRLRDLRDASTTVSALPLKRGVRHANDLCLPLLQCRRRHDSNVHEQCADEREALRIAVADCGECQRIQVSTGDEIIWSGSLDEATAA